MKLKNKLKNTLKKKDPEIVQQVTITLLDNRQQTITSDPKLSGWAILGFWNP